MSRTKKTLIACLVAVFLLGISAAAALTFASETDGVKGLPEGIEAEVTNELPVGTALDFGGTYIVADGESLDTSVETTYPDGRIVSSKQVSLDTMGVYEIALYGFTSGGVYTEHTLRVYAYNETFSFDDELSESHYGEHKNV